MVPLYRVTWELMDGVTQDSIEELVLEEAVEVLAIKAKDLGYSFRWLQIEVM